MNTLGITGNKTLWHKIDYSEPYTETNLSLNLALKLSPDEMTLLRN